MEAEEVLEKKRKILLRGLGQKRNIKFSLAKLERTLWEALLARGDRRLSKIIETVFFKEIDSLGNLELHPWRFWQEALLEEDLDYHFFLQKNTENFPWSFIKQ